MSHTLDKLSGYQAELDRGGPRPPLLETEYPVRLAFQDKNFFYDDEYHFGDLPPEMEGWLTDHLGEDYAIWSHQGQIIIGFRDPDAAFHFRMRFL